MYKYKICLSLECFYFFIWYFFDKFLFLLFKEIGLLLKNKLRELGKDKF